MDLFRKQECQILRDEIKSLHAKLDEERAKVLDLSVKLSAFASQPVNNVPHGTVSTEKFPIPPRSWQQLRDQMENSSDIEGVRFERAAKAHSQI